MKSKTISQGLPVLSSQLFIWAFIPYRIKEQQLISDFYDTPAYRQELANVFWELGIQWKWQPITFENMYAVVEEVAASSKEHIPVVLNFCDGFDEVDSYPGISVIKLLEAKGIIFTGPNSNFYHLTTSKVLMKRTLLEAGVATAPYEVVTDRSHVQGVCECLGTPLIVKPAISYGSFGLSLQSVVETDEQLNLQVHHLLYGQQEMQFPPDSIYVERFINGSEFTVLVLGSVYQPESIKIYPPMERVFDSNLPDAQRFIVYDRHLPTDAEETFLSLEKSVCRFQLVAPDLHDKLCELTRRAYCAVEGTGYGRVDIRMDKASQELFVLEVNASCALSSTPVSEGGNSWSDEDPHATSVGTILHLSGIPFAQLMSELIAEAFARHSTKSRLINQSV